MPWSWVRSMLTVLLTVGILVLSGCCSIARALCPVEPALVTNTRLTRDTPDEALDYLIAGIDDRRVADIFDCLDPDFIARHGGFNLGEFTSAFDHFEAAFQEDAQKLRSADRVETQRGEFATIDVTSGELSGTIVFRRRDVAFIKTTDDFVPESSAVVAPLGTLLADRAGAVVLTQGVRFAGMDSLDPETIVRLEFRRDWLVHELRNVHGVRLIDRINERF